MELWHFQSFDRFPHLIHGISDRTFGSVHPPEAGGRKALAAALGIREDELVSTRQVHETDVIRVPSPGYGRWKEGHGADGLITNTPGVYLMGYFADCVPLLAYDPARRAAGLAHAGWRGTLKGMARRLVEEMASSFGTRPADLWVGIGPSIGPCCYEVGSEVIAGVEERFSPLDGLLRPARSDHAYLDLWLANRRLFEQAGVPTEQIEVAGICTASNVGRYFSYRREGRLNGLFGAVVGIRG